MSDEKKLSPVEGFKIASNYLRGDLGKELVDGTDLQTVLEREPKLPADRAARIALCIADGLGAGDRVVTVITNNRR